MVIKNKIISFWKQVKLKSSDMFTLFRVGIGVKVPTHKLHIKDSKDPLKIEGLQNDTTDPNKYLTIDSSNIVKYRTGSEVLSDIIGASTDFTMDNLTVDSIKFTGEHITTDNDDFNITLDSEGAHSDSVFSINSNSPSVYLFRITEGDPTTYSFKRGADAVLVSEGNMTFRIDGDADELGQSFTWQNNSSTEIASLTEAGAFTTKNIILGDADDTNTTVIKTPSTDANGGDLTIISGDGAGTNKTGGDLVLRAGDSTGNAEGGEIIFKSTTAGSSGSSANATLTLAQMSSTGNLVITGDLTVSGGDIFKVASINSPTDLDMLFISDGNMSFRLDNDNDETGQSFSFNNYTTEIANLDESGNLQIDGGLTTGSTSAINSSGLIQVANQSNITGVGTISSGTWQGTAIALAYLDSNTANLTTTQTFLGQKTFAKPLIVDDNRSLAPGNGAAIHVEALDITDNDTSASGTATLFALVNIKNPRVLASNASVTTTTAATVYIKGAPVASTNQTLTNSYALYIAAGASYFGAPIEVNAASSNVAISCESTDADCMVQVKDNSTAGTNAIGMVATGDDLVMRNDEGNFKVKVANNATDALTVDQSGNLTVTGLVTGKKREVFFQNFFDDLGTTKHYLPFKSQSEQTTIYQEEAAVVMPCDGRIVSVTVRVNFPNADGDMTIGIHTRPVNVSAFTTASWVEEETETLTIENADDSHAFHFAFDNAKHFESSELVSISIQCASDISANAYWYVSTVVEYDWGTFLGTTSAEIDSTP